MKRNVLRIPPNVAPPASQRYTSPTHLICPTRIRFAFAVNPNPQRTQTGVIVNAAPQIVVVSPTISPGAKPKMIGSVRTAIIDSGSKSPENAMIRRSADSGCSRITFSRLPRKPPAATATSHTPSVRPSTISTPANAASSSRRRRICATCAKKPTYTDVQIACRFMMNNISSCTPKC